MNSMGTYLNKTPSVISKRRGFNTGRTTSSLENRAWLSIPNKAEGIISLPPGTFSLPLYVIVLLPNVIAFFVVTDDTSRSRPKQAARNHFNPFDGK
jgi:hypothetical protein